MITVSYNKNNYSYNNIHHIIRNDKKKFIEKTYSFLAYYAP